MANEAERLAALEAQLTDIKGALLRMEAKFDAWSAHYVPRQEINEMLSKRDEKIADLREEVRELREDKKSKTSQLPLWVSVAVSVAAFLYAVWPKK